MEITAILDRVCSGEIVEGYRIIERGVDPEGKYYLIEGPTGKIYRYSILRPSVLENMEIDRYNRVHRYRRPNDKIMFYYNTKTRDFQILAVKDGDDLSEPPFNLEDSFRVGEHERSPEKGLVEISVKEMAHLVSAEIISAEDANVILAMKKNVGFYLAKEESR